MDLKEGDTIDIAGTLLTVRHFYEGRYCLVDTSKVGEARFMSAKLALHKAGVYSALRVYDSNHTSPVVPLKVLNTILAHLKIKLSKRWN